jgi:hypothetical protein
MYLYVDGDMFASSTKECILKNMCGQKNVSMKNCFWDFHDFISPAVQAGLGAHPAFCGMGTGSVALRLKEVYSYTIASPLNLHGLL